MTLALATQTAIAFNDRDENLDRDDGPVPQPVQSTAGLSLHARFLEEEIQFRTATVAPDMTILKLRALAWLRRQPGYDNTTEHWLDVTASGLVSFTRRWLAAYEGFRKAPATPN
ncbi:hypothetical protein [Burkholderia sp. LMG 13014]|uniref:hypothetical protein n=1 Tax=Burkholderia sp. LMG 13014 TaxID=2709306 RepID=UPI00196551F9|nr:hypothetical protein [Burkholderia sp. LMG 13014]